MLMQTFFFQAALESFDIRLEVGPMWRQNIHRAARTQQVTGEGRGKTVGGLTTHKTRIAVIDDTARYALFVESGGHAQQRVFPIEPGAALPALLPRRPP